MASTTPHNGAEPRRRPLQAYNSFPRIDSTSPGSTLRSRSSTIDGAVANIKSGDETNNIENAKSRAESDVLDSTADARAKGDAGRVENGAKVPSDFDELPVELTSLTDT